jgi:nucleotide-binding universal stress UspA family protein
VFKNILVATDGSDLAAKAVEQGIRFAKEIGAKITAVTITEPFHVLSLAPGELEYTRSNTRSMRGSGREGA